MTINACRSCLQIARAFGASAAIAVDISDEKLEKAKAVGATHTVNAQKEDAVEKIKVLYFPHLLLVSVFIFPLELLSHVRV